MRLSLTTIVQVCIILLAFMAAVNFNFYSEGQDQIVQGIRAVILIQIYVYSTQSEAMLAMLRVVKTLIQLQEQTNDQ